MFRPQAPSGREELAIATETIVLEDLRAIRATQDRHAGRRLEPQGRAGILEQQYANLPNRVDRMDNRLDRIERWLDLPKA